VSFLDILLPVRCVVCAAGGEQLCAGCRESLPLLRPPLCERCGAPTAWPVARCRECFGRRLAFASARAATEYDGSVRRFVAAWKERGLRRLALEAAELVAGAFRSAAEAPSRVALVDDVYTSGATAAAAASALRKGGARRVEVITFARVVR